MKTNKELKEFIKDHIDTCEKIIEQCECKWIKPTKFAEEAMKEQADFEREQMKLYKAVIRKLDKLDALEEEVKELIKINNKLKIELYTLKHEKTAGEKGSEDNGNV